MEFRLYDYILVVGEVFLVFSVGGGFCFRGRGFFLNIRKEFRCCVVKRDD